MTVYPQARTDDQIRRDVELELKWDPIITSSDIAVAVKDGVVTLSGFVSSFWEKSEAEKAAKRIHGVRAVANDVEIKLFWERTDPEIARAIVNALENSTHGRLFCRVIRSRVVRRWTYRKNPLGNL